MKNNFVILLLVIISGCNQSDHSSQQETALVNDGEVNVVKEPIAVQVEEEVVVESFDFSYQDLDNNEIKLSDYRGKWVVVNYWATWCTPCRKEMPDFVKFKSQYSDKAEIIGIDYEDTDIEIIREFVEEYKINYPIVRTNVDNPTEFDRENTLGLPTTVIFNPQGIQVSKKVGPLHFDELVEIVGFNKES